MSFSGPNLVFDGAAGAKPLIFHRGLMRGLRNLHLLEEMGVGYQVQRYMSDDGMLQ